MIKIPADGQFNQPNNGDRFGNIWITKNVNFDNEGYITQSSGQYLFNSTDADFQEIESMFASDTTVYYLTDDLFRGDAGIANTITNVTTAESAPTPGVEDDGIFFNDTQVVSDGTTIQWNNAGTWTTITGTGLPTSGVVCMAVFDEQNSLLIGRGNEVAIVSIAWAVGTSLVLPEQYEVTSIECIGSTAYIATRHDGNGDAKLFLWDGAGADNNGAFSVGATELSTIKNYQATICGVDSLGRFLRFNGGGFDVITAFPIYYTKYHWGDSLGQYAFISNRGMFVHGDLVYFSVSSEIESNTLYYLDILPGGLWCYDPKVGLYHRNGKTISKPLIDISVDTGDINTTTNVITVSGITVPRTGTPVYYNIGTTAIGGLTDQTWYYTIYVSNTTFQLATTLENAINETAIDLTSATNSNAFYFIERKDYSATLTDNRTSVLSLVNTLHNDRTSEMIIHTNGRNQLEATDTPVYGINCATAELENRSVVITPKIFSGEIEDMYNAVTLRYKPLKYGDSILLKYRRAEREGLPILPKASTDKGTWTSTTTFTTTMDLSKAQVGDEVEIVGGQGAGHMAHITTISLSGSTYTVTIGDACVMASNGQFMRFIINNWTYVDAVTSTYGLNYKSFPIDKNSDWLQLKIEIRGTNVSLSDIIVDNKAYNPVQK